MLEIEHPNAEPINCTAGLAGVTDIFRTCGLSKYPQGDYRKAGTVIAVQDRTIGKTVYVLRGTVPAACFLQLPGSPQTELNLTGKYLYVQVLTEQVLRHSAAHHLNGLNRSSWHTSDHTAWMQLSLKHVCVYLKNAYIR